MPAISRAVGTTSQLISVFVPDATVSTGAGLANIVASTVNLAWYRNDMSAVSSNTLTSGTLGTWTGSTFSQINSTSTLGWYQVSIPNGVFASGDNAILHLYGPATMAPVPVLIELTKFNNQNFVSSYVFSSTNVVSTVSGSVGVSSIVVGEKLVGVSTIAVSEKLVGVSTIAVSEKLVGVSSYTRQVGVSSASVDFGVSTLAVSEKLVGVSTIAVTEKLVGVSTIATSQKLVGVSTLTTPAGVSSIAVAERQAVADALLGRNVSSGGNGGRTVSEALFVLRNKVDLGVGTVFATDDTTPAWTFTVSTQPSNPLVSITPV